MKQLTQEELQQLQTTIQKYEETSFRTGQYTIEIEAMKAERRKLIDIANQALDEREQIQIQLEEKYGTGTQINPVTGEIKE
jgi:ribosomal protein S13